jgi:hypothetical protein
VKKEVHGVIKATTPIPRENIQIEVVELTPLCEPGVRSQAQEVHHTVGNDDLVIEVPKKSRRPCFFNPEE